MKQGTILIVDDNRNILTTVKMLLENIFEHIVAIANPNNIRRTCVRTSPTWCCST